MTRRLRDHDIRALLTTTLHQQHAHDPDTLIRHEMGLCAGRRRVDVAVINGELSGYEIKSDVDTLDRLAGQAKVYGRVMDRMTLVTTPRHLEAAARMLPGWWGLAVADAGQLHTTCDAALNRRVESMELVQLLWREEALDELRKRGLARGLAKKRRWFVWQRLAEVLPLGELQAVVRDRLRYRQDWGGDR